MKCDHFLNRYLLLDAAERAPLAIQLHLMHCRRCRKLIHSIEIGAAVQRDILYRPLPSNDALVAVTMNSIHRLQRQNAILPAPIQQTHSVSFPWILAGLFLIAGFIIIPISDIGRWGLQQFGYAFSIPFALLCAGSIIGYSAIFIAKNIIFFTEKFDIA